MNCRIVRSGFEINGNSGYPFIWIKKRHPATDEVQTCVEESILADVGDLVSLVTNSDHTGCLDVYAVFTPRGTDEV